MSTFNSQQDWVVLRCRLLWFCQISFGNGDATIQSNYPDLLLFTHSGPEHWKSICFFSKPSFSVSMMLTQRSRENSSRGIYVNLLIWERFILIMDACKVSFLQQSKRQFKVIAKAMPVFNTTRCCSPDFPWKCSYRLWLQVSTARSGQTQFLPRAVDIGPTWSFPPESRTDRVRRDSGEMEKEIVVLRRVKLECLFAGTVEWAAGSCLALNFLW